MGLLDDAIREHLDLKRRRGADPEEIERAEREALGPVRRAPEPVDELASEDSPDEHEPLPYDDQEPEWVQPFEQDEHDHLNQGRAGDEPPPAPAAQPTSEGDLEQETVEYELEPQRDPEDDVLESTPEFLQDTPDHDRLWFEQRPPRDFDFDG